MIIAVLNLCGIHILGRGTALSIRVNLTVSLAVETAATQTKPAYAGFSNLDFPLVRAGGLGFYSRDSVAGRASVHFQSPGLKLTPIDIIVPLPCGLYNRELL